MESSQGKGKRTEELHQRFRKLEQEWEAYKESKPTASRKHSLPPSNKTIQKPHKYSSRELMFNLQQESPSPPEAWKNVTRIKDLAVREILQERREAIKRGKLKGRRLFQSSTSEDESSDREVRSISFCNSEEKSNESDGVHDYCSRELSSLTSSSSSCFAGDDNHDQDMEKMAHLMAIIAEMRVASVSGTGRNGGMRYAVFLGGVAVFLLVIAMYMRRFGGEDCDMILVPT